jgi:hypothetical protein
MTGESYTNALRSIRRDHQEGRMPASATTADVVIASCSFCTKPNTEVDRLVAGPGAFICNECVDLSATIIATTVETTPAESAGRRAAFLDRSAPEMLALLPALARSAAQLEADMSRWVGRLRELGTEWQQIADAVGWGVDTARQHFDRQP